uniref:RAP domain-containing protein n=1 Tax=Glossina brevipalpis TaxID=37001 RepID=A0A1A9WNF9_9MUSC
MLRSLKSVLSVQYKYSVFLKETTGWMIGRNLHTNQIRTAKMYVDRENIYAHTILEQSANPYQLFALHEPGQFKYTDLDESVLSLKNAEKSIKGKDKLEILLENFRAVAFYCKDTNSLISEQRFKEFINRYCDIVPLLSDEQLLESLRLLLILPREATTRADNFIELWNVLDMECCQRIKDWDTNQLLLVCDAWYKLDMARICDFVKNALEKLGRKVRKMTPSQLVQTMFLCNVTRRSLYEMMDFQINLARYAHGMSLDELGVMSMGFFKTQSAIQNPELLDHLYERLINELDTAKDITMVAILKVLRYSSKIRQANRMEELLNKMSQLNLDTKSLLTCLHVALFGIELQLCHNGILEYVLQRFERDLEQTRLKDLERICLVLGLFKAKTLTNLEKTLCTRILNMLQNRTDEILKHPRCFLNCLHYLTLCGFYNKDMMAAALDEKFLKHTFGSNFISNRNLFHLDTFVNVNLKNENYLGPQLSDKCRKTMGKMLTCYIPERDQKYKLSATDNVLLQINDITSTLLNHSALKHILPNYERPDIVICYNREKRISIPLSETCPEDYTGVILTRKHLLGELDTASYDTVAIVIAGWNTLIRNTDNYTGHFSMKLQQLNLLDHKYIVINWYEWRELETHKDRIDFIRRRLSKVIYL